MALGKKAFNSRIDTLLHQNMAMQRYCRRSYMQHVDFTRVLAVLGEYNAGRPAPERLRVPAVLMRAVALCYAHEDAEGQRPFRRLSGYVSPLPWGGSWESETIDISLMLVRELDGVKNQTCAVRFPAVDSLNSVGLSREIWQAATGPEDQFPHLVALKRLARIPPPIRALLGPLARIPAIQAELAAPTSVSILKDDIAWGQGEHTSMFGLAAIDRESNRGYLQWTFDHRLGMGLHFGPFIALVKHTLEHPDFLDADVDSWGAGVKNHAA